MYLLKVPVIKYFSQFLTLFLWIFFNILTAQIVMSHVRVVKGQKIETYKALNADLHVITFCKFVLQTVIENVNVS